LLSFWEEKHVQDDGSPGVAALSRARSRSLSIALAQAPVEVSFFYPVAVGGPITKMIDGYRRRFREGESRHQAEADLLRQRTRTSITKALTAVKSGEPPVTSILLSTDMFTLIDEEAIVPSTISSDTGRREVAQVVLSAFMENSQTGGKTWGIPFQRSTIVLYWNKEMFKEGRARSESRAGQLEGDGRLRAEAHQARCVGQGHAVGAADPSSGFPYWLFQALAIENGVNLMNAAGTETYYDSPRSSRRCSTGSISQGSRKCIRKASSNGERRRRTSSRRDGDDVDHHRQLDQRAQQREIRLRRRDASSRQAARQPDRRRQLLPVQEELAGAAAGGVQVHQVDHHARASGAVGIDNRVRGGTRRRVGDGGDEAVRCGISGGGVARDQLPYAKAELSTHDNQRVTKALNDGLQAALTGTKTPEAAMKDAQREAERLLRQYKK
jgi:sn-glycerol 3-phosphate transport system substrate-binding protein